MNGSGSQGSHALSPIYEFARDLSVAGELHTILQAIVHHVGRAFDRQVAILLPGEGGALAVSGASPGFELGEDGLTAARWVFEHHQSAAQGAGGLSTSSVRCLPMNTPREVVGVLGVASAAPAYPLSGEQLELMEVFTSQAALAIEGATLAKHARQVQLLKATEELQSALLHSISHDLRTPLVAITVALSNLETAGDRLDEATRHSLARTGRQEAERLNRLVGNLLDITRIEGGALKATEEPCDVEEAIGAALDRLAPELDEQPAGLMEMDERPVVVELPDELPPVPMDLALMVQALVNVLDNAVKYSPDGTQVDISASQVDDQVEIRIADRGVGIRPEDRTHIFDKFYRVQRPDGVRGTGLGLAISKGIVVAHGGRIWAEERPGGGTVVSIALPLIRPLSRPRS
jgi:two-component system, OmpR family, sensor histidine kinase KdpD